MTPTFPNTETNTAKVLITNITQVATDGIPVGHVFVNTLKASAWVREGEGIYKAITGTLWKDDCLHIGGLGSGSSANRNAAILLTDSDEIPVGTLQLAPFEDADGRLVIRIITNNNAGIRTDLYDLIGTTTISLPEIKLYNKYLS